MSIPSILRIPIPNPFFESATNVYCIPADPITLIDTGIGLDDAFRTLEDGLRSHGIPLESIGQIVLTHKHPDHMGLAARIQERSGAQVFVHEADWLDVTEFEERHAEFTSLVEQRLRRFGTPEPVVQSFPAIFERSKRFARSASAIPIRDGDRVTIAEEDLVVCHTPGHTQGLICLRYGNCLFTGDHLLPDYTPNIGGGEVRQSGMLARYLDSLQRIGALAHKSLEVLPGHGQRIDDLEALIQATQHHHHERAERVLEILKSGQPRTVFELAEALFGTMEGYHVILGTGEASAHAEWLEEQGRVASENDRYRLA